MGDAASTRARPGLGGGETDTALLVAPQHATPSGDRCVHDGGLANHPFVGTQKSDAMLGPRAGTDAVIARRLATSGVAAIAHTPVRRDLHDAVFIQQEVDY